MSNQQYEVVDVVLAITYKCNSRCIMCNIWKERDHEGEFTTQDLKNLPSTAKYVNVTGGEPFLRPDIVEIVRQIRKYSPKAQIIISTNGFLTDFISRRVEEILTFYPQIGIRVSIDGMYEKHEQTRGIPHAFDKCIATIKALQEIGVKNLGIGHTILDENPGEAERIYNLTRDLKIELSLALAQNSEIFFKKTDNKIKNFDNLRSQLEYLIDKELKSFSVKRWARAYFDYGAWRFFRYNERVLPEGSGKDSVFVSPKGQVYPADYVNHEIGNIKNQNINDIVNSQEAEKARQTTCKNNPYEAWMICTLRGSFEANKWNVLLWAIKNKLKVHLGQKVLK
ncbi:hypothetical protein A2X44_04950 [candidate division CPR3 bacterium GWF2_35_18]|uniref:Radical SAM domain protein n=1 Tax=candidate division CPR3 bacterium GW2011_GWF2_35_18 TaxID=1618350 RepID=A0A0G0ER73_UNCC3|nr:MAG: Radical SAM domain protein [candidate division CPR3 bacterium GW2011_GWF2_35_18]OGB63682.1 MAG: hypothetical protein A2X44_04950 [candidate division CPR3 bacterium GWF2_35_18]OGB64998.1 MAG: hypothetical protein A2250_01095 [candidate division CPR3 bacterium RIFOXYA2_FULL_35_13]OGB79126.1 MAG: hypothetical protein A2296_04445 [candidate division CPR3 bacterium RIFOXYB2_FULL_35_8]